MSQGLVEGVVSYGRQLGRSLGFPTANIPVTTDLDASDGVYRSRVEIDGVWMDAMSNLGTNPSVGGVERLLETHVFDFSDTLYGRRIRVELIEKIRDERKFGSLEELQAQIALDRTMILKLNKLNK